MLNKVMLIGNLCGDPEIRFTQGGDAVANFSLATNEKWKDKSGTTQETVEFHRIVIWGRLAEVCGEYLTKGSKIYIEGKIQTKQWEDKDGNKRYTTEIIAREMKMLSPKNSVREDSPEQTPPAGNDGLTDVPF